MSTSTATLVSRGLIALIVAMTIGSFFMAARTDPHEVTASVIVGDATAAGGPAAHAAIEEHIAKGSIAHPSTLRPTTIIGGEPRVDSAAGWGTTVVGVVPARSSA